MIYVCVRWIHTIPSEPVFIYSEVDSDNFELRKAEVYADGRMGFSDGTNSAGESMLSAEPLPSLQEIATDLQFVPVEITQEEFEMMWSAALLRRRA
ncbi:DUF6881 domain-containing protein [Ralstonia pseudosolanacearum]|uniref:DUF6881 domain-containing protein n=1 Tax=Ralstonia pseudosolanacearum TaxID=1310165 RepID=UPI0007D85A85|nr:hypothetical protein [Ralstonia pseudosolanacearum]OAK88762.1 hypothetical protein AB851_23510 [Ralstonia pseudosolanacearum]